MPIPHPHPRRLCVARGCHSAHLPYTTFLSTPHPSGRAARNPRHHAPRFADCQTHARHAGGVPCRGILNFRLAQKGGGDRYTKAPRIPLNPCNQCNGPPGRYWWHRLFSGQEKARRRRRWDRPSPAAPSHLIAKHRALRPASSYATLHAPVVYSPIVTLLGILAIQVALTRA